MTYNWPRGSVVNQSQKQCEQMTLSGGQLNEREKESLSVQTL